MRRFALVLLLATLSWVGLPPAQASLTRAMDLADLTRAAGQIVVADVAKVECQWDKDHRTIYSTVEIRVQESWKGTPPPDGKIVLRYPGGSVGDIEVTVVGMSTFSVGERALLFLDDVGVLGMGQGRRSLHWDATGKRWLAGSADLSTAVHIDRRGQIRAATASPPEPLDNLRAKVRALLGK
jgi:hypothetical protein